MADLAAIKIRRQILDVEVEGTESAGLALQRSLPTLCAELLSPALESALARFDPGDDYLQVERLTIDMTSTLERLGVDLAEAVERGIAEYFLRNPPPTRSESVAAGRTDEVRRRTRAETIDEALVAFLRTGRLPWFFLVLPGSRLEDMVLDTWASVDSEPAPPPRTRALLKEVLALSTARARLVMQFTPGFAMTVLQSLSLRVAAELEEVLRVVETLGSPSPVNVEFTRRLWDAALAVGAVDSENRTGRAELVETAWRAMDPDERHDTDLVDIVEDHWPGVIKQTGSLHDRDMATPQPLAISSRMEASDESEGILVANAGIVLLHPFLARFFEGLGIVVEEDLLDPNRGLCLLHFLATGEPTAPEHQLSVAKALCGVQLEEPVEAEVGLTTSEMDEADALLRAAISHWEALLSTSPDALRGEFLTRQGQLSLDDEGNWLLRVEARTVDILLDRLPWGISMVKLPWMTRLMRVEWR